MSGELGLNVDTSLFFQNIDYALNVTADAVAHLIVATRNFDVVDFTDGEEHVTFDADDGLPNLLELDALISSGVWGWSSESREYQIPLAGKDADGNMVELIIRSKVDVAELIALLTVTRFGDEDEQ